MQWRRRGPSHSPAHIIRNLALWCARRARATPSLSLSLSPCMHGQVFLREIWHLDIVARVKVFNFRFHRRYHGGVFMSRAALIIYLYGADS